MTKVEREHEPRSWAAWATTRADFAALVDEAAQIVNTETGGPTTFDIDVPGFERPFTSTAEFLENVTETGWTTATNVRVTLWSGEFADEPGRLSVYFHIWKLEATLRLSGRNRRSRNAIAPDLESLISKHARQSHGQGRTLFLVYSPILIVQMAALLGLSRALTALGLSRLAAIVIATICVYVPTVYAAIRLVRWTQRITQPVEFLPNSGISTWDAAWQAKRRQAAVTGKVLGCISAVGGFVIAIIAFGK